MLVPALLFKDFYKKLGPIKYSIVMVFMLSMFFVIIKIVMRFMDIKYIVSYPQWSLNV